MRAFLASFSPDMMTSNDNSETNNEWRGIGQTSKEVFVGVMMGWGKIGLRGVRSSPFSRTPPPPLHQPVMRALFQTPPILSGARNTKL